MSFIAGLPPTLLVHTATPVRAVEGEAGGEWHAGEPGENGPQPQRDASFPCVLFLPNAPEGTVLEASWRPRTVTRPTLMYNPAECTGPQPTKGDELAVLAPELAAWAGAEEARWQVDGVPQPFGPPGSVIGALVGLKAVVD